MPGGTPPVTTTDPAGPVTVVTIGGSVVANPWPIWLRRLIKYSRGGTPTAEFWVRGGALPGLSDPYRSKPITIAISGTLVFAGIVQSPRLIYHPKFGWWRQYQCAGLRDQCDWFRHADSNDGSTASPYNQSLDTQGPNYIAARAGRTVGQILADVLTMTANANALASVGVGNYTGLPSAPALPSTTVADLAALTVIPPQGASFGGDRLGSAVQAFVDQWAPNVFFSVEPNGDMRFLDQRSFTAHTLTMGVDPIDPVELSSDTSHCASRVEVAGADIAEMHLFSVAKGTLLETPFAHDGLTIAQAIAAWVPNDYFQTQGLAGATALADVTGLSSGAVSTVGILQGGYGYAASSSSIPAAFTGGGGTGAAGHAVTNSSGVVTGFSLGSGGSGYTTAPSVSIAAPGGPNSDSGTATCPSTLTVTITSANPSTNFPANYFDQTSGGRHGQVFLNYSAGTGIGSNATRRVVSNTAMAPGGTATLTLDSPLPNTLYDTYVITGLSENASDVWVLYQLPSYVSGSIARQSSYPFPFVNSDGQSVTLTSFPTGQVLYSQSGLPPYTGGTTQVTVDPGTGQVRFGYPTYITAGYNTPTDVLALVPIYTGTNVVHSPQDISGVPQYAGTYHTIDGVQKTLQVYIPGWRDPGNASGVQAYADNLLDSVKDVVYEGVVMYHGLYPTALTLGVALNIAGNGYTTGWETGSLAALPVLECEVLWPEAGATQHVTSMRVSNRRGCLNPGAFLAPDRTGTAWDWVESFAAPSPSYSGPATAGDVAGSVATAGSLASSTPTSGSLAGSTPAAGGLAPNIAPDTSAEQQWAKENVPLLGRTIAPAGGWKITSDPFDDA